MTRAELTILIVLDEAARELPTSEVAKRAGVSEEKTRDALDSLRQARRVSGRSVRRNNHGPTYLWRRPLLDILADHPPEPARSAR